MPALADQGEESAVAAGRPGTDLPGDSHAGRALEPGTLVRISGWVRVPPPGIVASTDGALIYDSAGGEPLAIRQSSPLPKWQQFLLYRKVPASGTINVTLALTGIGTVYFDDVRIEPLQSAR